MFSLCICTFNRAESLERTLVSVAAADKPKGDWELLIVDNNSTDQTRSTVSRCLDGSLPIRYLRETKQGLSHARNRAVAEAHGDTLLFTDDDVQLDRSWLLAYQEAFDAFPDVEFFGGRILPDWNGNRAPRWLKGECLHLLDGVLVWYDHGTETRACAANEPLPFGASFAVRRSLIGSNGGFRTDLGKSGNTSGLGEETEFLQRAIDA